MSRHKQPTDDNSCSNLKPVSVLEHRAEHSRINLEEAARLYSEGWSLPRLAEKYGVGNSTVLRFLRRRGVRIRSLSEAWKFRKVS